MDGYSITEATLRNAARQALRDLDDALAVLLFGSRAYGTARPDSDWDVAMITHEAERIRPPDAFSHLQAEINIVTMPLARLRKKRNDAGSLAVSIARDGKLLAGHIPYLGHLEQKPRMKPEELTDGAHGILRIIIVLGREAAATADPTAPEFEVAGFGRTLVRESTDAVELFAKLAMQRRIGHYPYSHDLNALASTLEGRDTERRWGNLVTLLRNLNGDTRGHHLAMYAETQVSAADVDHAAGRFTLLLPALVDEFRDAALTPTLAEAANSVLADLHGGCQRVLQGFPETLEPVPEDFGDIAAAAHEALPDMRRAFNEIVNPPSMTPKQAPGDPTEPETR